MANKKLKLGLFDQNPIEAQLRGVTDGVVKSLKDDVLEGSVTTAWKQLLQGSGEATKANVQEPREEGSVKSTEFKQGQEIDIFSKEQWARVEPAINYAAEIIQSHERTAGKEQNELRGRIQEIAIELRQISKSMQELEIEVKDINVEFIPARPGKYQINFLEWVVIQLKNARLRIQESATWMKVVTGKKEKRGYWAMAKKHGTTYSLSGERQVAQQVG